MSEDPSSRSLLSRLFSAFGAGQQGDATPAAPANGTLTHDGGDLLLNVQEFQSKRVEDVMVPRADILGVEIDTPLQELASVFGSGAHSRMPVYRETLDDPVGIAHIRDVVGHLAAAAEQRDEGWHDAKILGEIVRPLLYVPASMRALDLLLKMQSRRMHMALVVDEFGGTDGLVTLEDLLEPIVGDIEDEHDETDSPTILSKGTQCWDADARAQIAELEAVVGCDIASDEEEDDVDTLGGLVFHVAGRVPGRGEVIAHPSGFEFEVLDSDPRRIKRLRIRHKRDGGEPGTPQSDLMDGSRA